MLHILNKAPHSDVAHQMLQAIGAEDVLLLIEEAVQAILDPEWVGWQQFATRIYLLEEDVMSRGFQREMHTYTFPVVTLSEFVALTEQHEQCVTWY